MDLKTAKEHLKAWYAAELAVTKGQEYRIGSRQLTRASLSDIRKQITYWERKIKQMEGKGSRRVFRAVPRDF